MPLIIRRSLVAVYLSLFVLLCWYYIVYGMTMNMKPVTTWSVADIVTLYCMWAIMMAGMMVPSAVPVILLVEQLNKKRKHRQAAYTHTLFFVMGYIIAWSIYSVGITLVQWWLHHLSYLSPMMDSANVLFSATLLVAAGVYQFTPIKQRCLQRCRSPLAVISSQWQEGNCGAIRLGLKHGQYCVGCCWFLMALLFVTGVMNIQWIFMLTLIVIIEKTLPRGDLIAKALGIILIVFGVGYLT